MTATDLIPRPANLLAEAPRLIAWAKRNNLMSEKARPAVAAAAEEAVTPNHLSTLVKVGPLVGRVSPREGKWEAWAGEIRRTSMEAEVAARRAGIVQLLYRKRALGLPGLLEDDDYVVSEEVSPGVWKITWTPNREA